MQSHSTRQLAAFVLFSIVAALGCQPEPEIKSYTVASTAPRNKPFPVDQVDQILVGIVPQGSKAWFFKLTGKKPAIERQKEAFESFLNTVEPADSAEEKPSWQLPEGWSERGESEMRAATLLVPDRAGELELAVSSLPLPRDWDEFLVPNVNRWLRQLGSESLPQETILQLAEETGTKNGTATVFHLSGLMQQPAMGSNPHAGLGIPAPEATAKQQDSPPIASARGELTYETPTGWLPGKMSMMRKAAFLLPGGSPSDEVTVTRFPANGQMADVETNVLRWAGQVGMSPPTGEQLEALRQPITIDGQQGTYVELSSPESADQAVSLYVAMVERQGQVWFFKMLGNSELVASQGAAFRAFLDSVSFN